MALCVIAPGARYRGLLGARPAACHSQFAVRPRTPAHPPPDDRRARSPRPDSIAREPVRARERRERSLRQERSGSVVKGRRSDPGTCEDQRVDRRYAQCKTRL